MSLLTWVYAFTRTHRFGSAGAHLIASCLPAGSKRARMSSSPSSRAVPLPSPRSAWRGPARAARVRGDRARNAPPRRPKSALGLSARRPGSGALPRPLVRSDMRGHSGLHRRSIGGCLARGKGGAATDGPARAFAAPRRSAPCPRPSSDRSRGRHGGGSGRRACDRRCPGGCGRRRGGGRCREAGPGCRRARGRRGGRMWCRCTSLRRAACSGGNLP